LPGCEPEVGEAKDGRLPEAAVDPLLARLQRAGARVTRIVVTDNRRVMLSMGGPDRRTLRLHRCLVDAPESVVRAIVDLSAGRGGTRQARARAEIREFVAGRHTPAPRPRPREVRPEHAPHVERLRAEFERANATHFGGLLPTVPLHVSDAMRSRNGHFSRGPVEIVISRRLLVEACDGEAERTLRHEMIHLWQHVVGLRPDHGRAFRWWARLLDIHPRARRDVRWRGDDGTAPVP
jgi:hypothetical protein